MTTIADPTNWERRAADLSIGGSGRALISNEWVDARSGRTFDKHSPVDGRLLGSVAACDAADVDDAVATARKTFEAGTWSEAAPRERKNHLLKLAEAILANKEKLALISTLEMGKPISASRGEVDKTAQCLAYFAEAIDKVYGEVGPTPLDSLSLVTKEPAGVVGAVTPWNYPLAIPMWKLAPALATGNSVVWKPAEQTPLSALAIGEIALEADLPAGVLNVVTGFGETAGQAVGRHMEVDVISFTGSTEVGKLFLRYSGESNMKPVWLECGGKSPNLVLADAPDLAAAAEIIAEGVFVNAGQMCNAGTRLVVERDVADELLDAVVKAAEPWQPVHPFQPEARMGAIVDQTQFDRVLGYIDSGKEEARLVTGGNRALKETGGYYIEPTIFDDPSANARVSREEIFGPVLTVTKVDSLEEGIRVANDTPYGLAAAVWTRDIKRAFRTARALRAGSVYINAYDRGDISLPFPTFKQSGIGIDRGIHAMEKTTRVKMTWVDLAD